MDSEKILQMESKCIAENAPACNTMCPFHLDVKAFISEVKKGTYEKAYKQLEKKIPMPNVLCRICDHPCENKCIRKDFGGAVNISAIEKTVINAVSAKRKEPSYRKSGDVIAVIGAGLCGLNAALELLKRGFQVEMFEKETEIGGSLLNIDKNILPEDVLQDELDFIKNNVNKINYGVNVDENMLQNLKDKYKALFVAFGEGLNIEADNIFHKGKLSCENGYSVIQSAASGRSGGITVERFLQGVSLTALRENEGSYETKLVVNTEKVKHEEPFKISDNIYSKEEATLEAGRCINCECNECNRVCVHLRRYKMTIKKYLRQINHNERLVLGNHFANIMINSCSLCGLCTEVCPSAMNLKAMVKESRESMVDRGKMPPSAHDFALRDMEYNSSDAFHMVKNQPGFEKSSFVFFPGCQMAASEPEYVAKAYEYLAKNLTDGVGLMLGCCGAPADWAGRKELFNINLDKIKEDIKGLGNPTLIAACSTCYDILKRNLPELKIVSIWDIYDKYGLPEGTKQYDGKNIAVQDACTARHHDELQQSARNVIEKLGINISELEFSKNRTKCCGYGGLTLYADKSMAKDMIKERIGESELDYAAYCFMCRDLFKKEGKRVFHIFDYIYGKDMEELEGKKPPTISERQQNRKILKYNMLKEIWGENVKIENESKFKLKLSDLVLEKLEDRLILIKDIDEVLEHALETENVFVNPENGHLLSNETHQNVTYWVEYAKEDDEYTIYNAYSHRMGIVGE